MTYNVFCGTLNLALSIYLSVLPRFQTRCFISKLQSPEIVKSWEWWVKCLGWRSRYIEVLYFRYFLRFETTVHQRQLALKIKAEFSIF